MKKIYFYSSLVILSAGLFLVSGCSSDMLSGYSCESLYPQDISTVYVEMFDNKTFRRGLEYELSDAIAKRIENQTPYKIVTDRNRADTLISGQIVSISDSTLTSERNTGRPLEEEAEICVDVTWENLKTGDVLLNNERFSASASYTNWQGQGFDYASASAANSLAVKIVESIRKSW